MTKLEYTFKNDALFKMVFVKYPDLLRCLVAELLGIRAESIGEFSMEVPVMKEAIGAYRQVASTGELREIERLRSRARHNEASALRHARQVGAEREREKWQSVVEEKDAEIARLKAQLGRDK